MTTPVQCNKGYFSLIIISYFKYLLFFKVLHLLMLYLQVFFKDILNVDILVFYKRKKIA